MLGLKKVESTKITDSEDIVAHEMKSNLRICLDAENTEQYAPDFGIGNIEIEKLDFSVRTYNCLKRAGYIYLKDILLLSEEEFFKIRNLGRKSIDEIIFKTRPEELSKTIECLQHAEFDNSEEIEPQDKHLKSNEMSVRAFNILRQNQLLNEFEFLSLTDEQILKLKSCGRNTFEELVNLRNSKVITNVDYFVYKLKNSLQDISAENYMLNIELLVSEKTKKLLAEIGIKNIENLRDCTNDNLRVLFDVRNEIIGLIKLLSKSIFLTLRERFEWELVCNNSGKKIDKESDRNLELLLDRARGMNLAEAGKKHSLTRERVRQIESKKIKRFETFIRERIAIAFLDYLFKDASYVNAKDIANQFSYGEIFNYLLKTASVDRLTYIKDLDSFIYGENWFEEVERFVDDLPQTTTQKVFDEEIAKLFYSLRQKGVIFNEDDISTVIKANYKVNGEFLTSISIPMVLKYKTVLERDFKDGINVYDCKDLEKFRGCYNSIYDDGKVSANDRALISRIIPNCVLIGRGRYGLKKEDYISFDLLNAIFEYIIKSPHDIIMINTIYNAFENELCSEGVDNKYYLQGILREHFEDKFGFSRDYLSKTKEKGNYYSAIVEFVKSQRKVVHISEIRTAFQGVPDYVITTALDNDRIIASGDKTFWHADLLYAEGTEVEELRTKILELTENKNIIHVSRLFDIASEICPAMLRDNPIKNAFTLFSVAKYLFDGEIQFKRPFITQVDTVIEKQQERITAFVEQYDECFISEIREFVKENNLYIADLLNYINSLENYTRVDADLIIKNEILNIDVVKIDSIEAALKKQMNGKGYITAEQVEYIELPDIGGNWNRWLLQSLVTRRIADMSCFSFGNTYDSTAIVFIDKSLGLNSFQEFFEHVIECSSETIEQMSFGELRTWLINQGMIIKEVPQFVKERLKIFADDSADRNGASESIMGSANNAIEEAAITTNTPVQDGISKLFATVFPRGMRLQFIDFMKLRTAYEKYYGYELLLSDDEISVIINNSGFETEPNKFSHIDNLLYKTTIDEIEEFIEEQNDLGAKRIWIEPLYNYFRDKLGDAVNADLFAQILIKAGRKKYRKDDYYGYIHYAGISLDGQKEEMRQAVTNLLKQEGTNLTLDEIQQRLPAYPPLSTKKGLSLADSPDIVWLTDGSYAHIDCIYITADEIALIEKIIENDLDEAEQTIYDSVNSALREQVPSIFENNESFGISGVWKAIAAQLQDKYSFNSWQIKRKRG